METYLTQSHGVNKQQEMNHTESRCVGSLSHIIKQSANPTNSDIMSFDTPRQTERGIITKHKFGCKKPVIFKFWKYVTPKYKAHFFAVLGILYIATNGTCDF